MPLGLRVQTDSQTAAGKLNDLLMPIAWPRTYAKGQMGRVLTTAMGSSVESSDMKKLPALRLSATEISIAHEDPMPDLSLRRR